MHNNIYLSECIYRHFKFVNCLEFFFHETKVPFSGDLPIASSRREVTSGLTNVHVVTHEFSSCEAR